MQKKEMMGGEKTGWKRIEAREWKKKRNSVDEVDKVCSFLGECKETYQWGGGIGKK